MGSGKEFQEATRNATSSTIKKAFPQSGLGGGFTGTGAQKNTDKPEVFLAAGERASHKQFMSLPHPSATARRKESRPRPHPPLCPENEEPEPGVPGTLLLQGSGITEAAASPLLISSVSTRESPAIPRMGSLTEIPGYGLFCHREGYMPCQKSTLPNFLHQVMDIMIICGGICHCEDCHCSSRKFHRKAEIRKQLGVLQKFSRKGTSQRRRGRAELFCSVTVVSLDSVTFPTG